MATVHDHDGMRRESVRATARRLAPDHYIAALMAPASVRDDVIALAAFWGETGRIALSVSEAPLGEIRLQWWADELAAKPDADSGHPVADAMKAAAMRHDLNAEAVQQLIEARRAELYALPFADEAAFDRYLAETDGVIFALAARVRGVDADSAAPMAAAAAAVYGRVRVALDLPYFAALGRLPLWPDPAWSDAEEGDANAYAQGAACIIARLSTEARRRMTTLRNVASGADRRLIDAVLPAALLEPYLRALETKKREPMREVAAIAPLTRVTRLTWAHMRGRL